ncbi:hypothetical protein H5411_32650, partial [Amycolatopsis echigonensis]
MTEVSRVDDELPDFLQPEPFRAATRRPRRQPVDRPPGEYGLWIFIFGDLTLFAAFFVVFTWEAGHDRALFGDSARRLLVPLGAVNTLVLLLSSLLVVAAVRAYAAGAAAVASRASAGAIGCAAVFVSIKVTEYGHAVGAG